MCSRSWMEVQLLRVAHQIDVIDEALVDGNGERTKLSELQLDPQLAKDLLLLAGLFQKLNMDNSQLAVLSLALLYEALDEVCAPVLRAHAYAGFRKAKPARSSMSSTTPFSASWRTIQLQAIHRIAAVASLT